MASDILVKIGADITDFSRKMKESNKALKGFSDANKETFDSFKKVGTVITGAGLTLAAGLGVATNEAIKFEDSFAGVRKTVDATEAEFAELSQGFRDLTKEIPASIHEINGVGEAAGQLGIEKENILGFTRTMIDLGVATNLSSEEAATALARLANITGMPQTEFDKLGSTIVDLGNNLATTEGEIVEMGLRLAGAGKQVGMSEAEILSFAGALSSVGIEAEAGGSAFSKVMVNMALAAETGGDDLKEFAKVSGMSADEFKRAFEEDASGAMTSFIKGLSTAEERGLSAIGILDEMGITEVRMRDSLLRAAGASDVFTEAIEIGTNAWEENTALSEEAEERYKTVASQLQILKNTITDAAISLGEALMPAVKLVIGTIQKLVEWFNGLSESTKSTIAIVAAVTAGLMLIVGPLLLLIGFIPAIIAGFAALKLVFLAISWPIVAIVAGVIALGVAFVLAYNKIEWFRDAVNAVFERMKASVEFTFGLIMDVINIALDFIKSLWDEHGETLIGIVTTIWESIKEAIDGVISFIQEIVGQVLGKITEFWEEHGEFIMNYLTSVWDTLKSIIGIGVNSIRTMISNFMDTIKSVFMIVWPIISGFVKVAWAQIKTYVKNAIELVSGIINTVMSLIKGDWEGAWNTIKTTASNIMSNIVNTFKDVDLKQIGKDIIDGLVNGIKSKVTAVTDAVKDVTSKITGKIKGILGIKSPSRVLAQIGRWTGEGLVDGIAGTQSMVEKAADGLAHAAVPDISMDYATPTGVQSTLSSAINGTVDVNSREELIAGAIANLERRLDGMQVVMEGETVGRIVAPTVSEAINEGKNNAIRNGGRRRL